MPSRIVRCANCGDVVDAGPGTCSSCGAPLKVFTPPSEPATTYADKYRGTEFDQSPAEPMPVVAPPGQSYSTLLIGLGIALVVVVVAVSALLLTSAPPAPTAAPKIRAYSHSPTAGPTAQPVVQAAFEYLTAPDLAAKMTIHTDYLLDERVTNVSKTVSIDLNAVLDGSNSSGHFAATGFASYDFVCLSDKWYTKPGSKPWSGPVGTACALKLFQLFGFTSANQLAVDGEETLDGQHVFRLVTTSKWSCDVSRLSLMSTTGIVLKFQPEKPTLQIWVDDDGHPVKAFLTADYNAPTDGKRLMTLETTYTFTDVGIPNPIVAPK